MVENAVKKSTKFRRSENAGKIDKIAPDHGVVENAVKNRQNSGGQKMLGKIDKIDPDWPGVD